MHGNCIVLNNKVPVTYIYMINHSDSVLFATQTRTKPQLYERRQKLLKKLRPQKHWISFPRFEKKVCVLKSSTTSPRLKLFKFDFKLWTEP